MNNNSEKLLELFVKRYPQLAYLKKAIIDAIKILCSIAHKNGTVLICGNGGSAADSEHLSGELLKSFILPRPIEFNLRQKIKKKQKKDYCFAYKQNQALE